MKNLYWTMDLKLELDGSACEVATAEDGAVSKKCTEPGTGGGTRIKFNATASYEGFLNRLTLDQK